MGHQSGQETGKTCHPANHSHRLFKLNRRLDQSICDKFGENVGHPHHDLQSATNGSAGEHLRQFIPDDKDLFSISEDRLSDIGQDKPPARATEQILPKAVFEFFDLCAESLGRESKVSGGGRRGLKTRDRPEILQMVKIQIVH